jgi:hypothetical protein
MSARFLVWYTSALFALDAFLFLFISVAPGAELGFLILQLIFAGFAVVFAVIGVTLRRLPQDHWFNRSSVVRSVLVLTALCGTFLLAG